MLPRCGEDRTAGTEQPCFPLPRGHGRCPPSELVALHPLVPFRTGIGTPPPCHAPGEDVPRCHGQRNPPPRSLRLAKRIEEEPARQIHVLRLNPVDLFRPHPGFQHERCHVPEHRGCDGQIPRLFIEAENPRLLILLC